MRLYLNRVSIAAGSLASSLLILVLCVSITCTGGFSLPNPLNLETRGDPSSLRDWAKSNEIIFADGIGFSQSEGLDEDWQIQALDDGQQLQQLEKGSVLLSVPKDFVFRSGKIFHEMGGEAALGEALQTLEKREFTDHKGELLLFLKVLKEVKKGESSKWYSWIQCLPRTFSTGTYFDEIELECLPAFSRTLADYERVKLLVFGKCASMTEVAWANGNTDSASDRSALYNWAYNVVYTRCWKFSDELDSGTTEMVPIGDLFNHKEPGNVAVDNDPLGSSVDFILQNDMLGTGLSLSYGLTNPHRFLVIFGFVDEFLPEIFCQVVFPEATPEHVALGCSDRSKMVYSTSDGAISDTIWDSVLYILLASKPDEQKALYDAHIKGDLESKKSLRYKYALETSLTLKNHVDGTLDELATMVNVTDKAKQGNSLHQNLVLIEKHNLFLISVFKKVSALLDTMVTEESQRRRNAATE